jgi:hypothetical protein
VRRATAVPLFLLAASSLALANSGARDEVAIKTGEETCGASDSRHIYLESISDKVIIATLLHEQYKTHGPTSQNSYEEKIGPKTQVVLGCSIDDSGSEPEFHRWKITDARYP